MRARTARTPRTDAIFPDTQPVIIPSPTSFNDVKIGRDVPTNLPNTKILTIPSLQYKFKKKICTFVQFML